MKRSKYLLGFTMMGISFLNACSKNDVSYLYTPTESDTTANATLSELQQGRTLYIDNCERCHNLYSPDDFSAATWNNILAKMGPRTNMDQSQITLVKKYVSHGKL